MSLMDQYKKKLVSAEQAASVVKSGDLVEYGSFLGMVRACDKALAARKGELKDVIVRSCVTAYAPEVLLADPKGETFTWVSWHYSGADRKFADKGIPMYYTPIKYSEVPRLCRPRGTTSMSSCSRSTPWTSTASSTSGPSAPCPRRSASGPRSSSWK